MKAQTEKKTKNTLLMVKKLSAYIYMPIIFACLGVLILYISLSPIIKNASSILALITSDSASSFVDELSDEFVGSTVSGGDVSVKDIGYPKYNSKFAELSCDRLSLKAPVYHGDNDMCLHFGVGIPAYGTIPGFSKSVIVSGHNSTFFAPLENVQTGDIFTFATNYGQFEYEVKNIEIMSENDFDESVLKDKSGDKLILYTCYPFSFVGGVGDSRLFVTCDLISGPRVYDAEV